MMCVSVGYDGYTSYSLLPIPGGPYEESVGIRICHPGGIDTRGIDT